MNNYFIPFIPEADINYFHLLALYDIADYNTETKCYDTIQYTSINQLAVKASLSASTLRRMLDNDNYKLFIEHDKHNKIITIKNCFCKQNGIKQAFVILTEKEYQVISDFNKTKNDNLLIRYYLYIKYYCGIYKQSQKPQDFTAKQFLLAIGYSVNSQAQIDKISLYNGYLTKNELIKIDKYRDSNGKQRNIYFLLAL